MHRSHYLLCFVLFLAACLIFLMAHVAVKDMRERADLEEQLSSLEEQVCILNWFHDQNADPGLPQDSEDEGFNSKGAQANSICFVFLCGSDRK